MAVISCEQIFDGRRGKESTGRKLEHTQIWEVITDDDADDENTVGLAPELPVMGDPHPNSPSATMVDADASQSSESPRLWYVTCNFSSSLDKDHAKEVAGPNDDGESVETANPTDREENPLNRPATYKVESEQTTEIAEYDFNGDAIVNSAGEPFDPPAQVEVSYPMIVVEKNFPIGHPILALNIQSLYYDCTNDDVWRGIPIGQLRIVKIGCVYDFENGVAFGRVTFNMKLKWKGWKLKIVDCGFNWIQGGELKQIDVPKDGDGKAPETPQPLDGNGQRLNGNVGQIGTLPLVFREFQIYRGLAYATLGI